MLCLHHLQHCYNRVPSLFQYLTLESKGCVGSGLGLLSTSQLNPREGGGGCERAGDVGLILFSIPKFCPAGRGHN